MEDTTSILPRLKRNSNTYGIGALAKSSLSGVSGVSRTMKDHVTKPTAMAQGKVAHMIEWQSWGKPSAGRVMQQFAISEATLLAWSSIDGESLSAGSNQGSVAHLSEVNQESVTSRDQILHHSSADVWPHTYVSQGLYCLSSSDAWEPMSNEQSGVASPAAGSYVVGGGALDRLSQTQSLQATPNSTIHSQQAPHAHTPLVDLWGVAPAEAYQAEVGGYVGMSVGEGGVAIGEEPSVENEPLLEKDTSQEEEEDTLCRETETVTPSREEAVAVAGGNSPGTAPGESVTDRKSSDVTSCAIQSLQEEEETGEGSAVVTATN
ncbi:F131B protein, partial [Amia calva]|nr:F131B protein [Amia calva]